jgi:hypothetical protein
MPAIYHFLEQVNSSSTSEIVTYGTEEDLDMTSIKLDQHLYSGFAVLLSAL